jgi:hypothetical protein
MLSLEINTTIDEIIRKRKATAESPKEILDTLKSLELKIGQLEDLQRSIQNLPNSGTSVAVEKLNQIDFKVIFDRITQEIQIWKILLERLNRDTINIGVIGLARQGKSTFLQKVAELTDDEIPSSDRLPCTSVQSNILHFDKNTYAQVYFYSESSFLEQVIKPYYEELGFPDIPESLAEFRNSSFPSKPTSPRHPARAEAIYKHLRDDYRAHVDRYANLLQAEERNLLISKDEIKQYVSQDYDESGKPLLFNHLAVEKVEIFCPFPEIRVKKIGLVDMPGLGDTRLGDAERMIRALSQDVDFILFIRRPDKNGDLWGNRDVDLYDVAAQALKDKLPLEEWSFMLLNQDGENDQQCKDLENTRTSKGIHVKKCLKGNCKDRAAANQILKEVLDELVQNMARLDQQYISAASKGLKDFQTFSESKLQEVRQVIEGYGDVDTEYIKLKEHFVEQMYKEIEDFRAKIRQEFSQPSQEFKAQVDAAIEQCKQQVNIPDSQTLSIWAKSDGIDGAYFQAIQQMRSDVLRHFHLIEIGLQQAINKTKSDFAELLIRLGLGGLTEKQGTEFLEALAESLAKTNDLQNLALGFDFIASFEIMYKGFVQSRVWQNVSEILPPDPLVGVKTPEGIDAAINNLKQRHMKVVDICQKALEELGLSVSRVHISMVEEFADHITRAAGVRQEWDIFLNKNRVRIWTQLQELEEQKQLQQQWLSLVDETLAINHQL